MRDPEVVPSRSAFDIKRDEQLVAIPERQERAHEAPQSQLYLQHGYGRHKCLGRYASEITMRESLRALLRLGTTRAPERAGDGRPAPLRVSLRVGFPECDRLLTLMKRKVLVTGASSFLGYHVVKQLNEQGIRPRVLELRGSKARRR